MVSPQNPVQIYDTTLRDGCQREGLALSLEDKVRIAQHLDRLGIPFIEGGWPGANPKDEQFFLHLREYPLQQAKIVAFCSTRRPHSAVETDSLLQASLRAQTHWITLFGKSWDLHVTLGLGTTLAENCAMIRESLAYLKSQNRRVIYDAEHWFDGYQQNPEYALKTLEAAIQGGAEYLVLCDTNGGTLPQGIMTSLQDIQRAFPDLKIPLGIHTHNDSGMAVANAVMAVQAGATMVQGTINGYGERCGNANLCTLIPTLQLKLNQPCLAPEKLQQLTSTSRLISEIVNLAPDDHAPYVGRSAFAHKGGIHVSAVQKNALTYEHIDPQTVGNERRIVVSEQAGLSNILAKAKSFGIALEKTDLASRTILQKLKDLEHEGYQFEAAEASFQLLIRSALGHRQEFFKLRGFHVNCDVGETQSTAIATIKLEVNGKNLLEAAEGNGPVSALDQALRKVLTKFYPEIAEFQLTDYKVRILDGAAGTGAKTRVLVESSDGLERWTTVGVSANILEASYRAVVEGIEYGLLRRSPYPSVPLPVATL
ncbi:citramalate synthase [Synechococcus sp. BDU 130192]|uniref:citramalate synthase n=1 Tax=Synechococcus sp. BDU 130192 TaxID=2042059 RepID=UPI000C081BF3|nr:citramalate synthase [Synechococcus sp. BDU 130192]